MNALGHYNGGKSGNGTYQHIINHIPPHDIYVSATAGHDGIFQKIRRADISVINDQDPAVIDRWRKSAALKGCQVSEDFMQGNLFEARLGNPVIILRNNHYRQIIEKFRNNTRAFIYLDPPYKMDTRKSQKKLYLFDWESDAEHLECLNLIKDCSSLVMISAYENDLYNEVLHGWTTHRFNSMTRRGLREEIIYFNYPVPEVLHDFQYLGDNYRERERIKRKVNRHESRLNRLPAHERAAILSNIIAKHKTTVTSLIEL